MAAKLGLEKFGESTVLKGQQAIDTELLLEPKRFEKKMEKFIKGNGKYESLAAVELDKKELTKIFLDEDEKKFVVAQSKRFVTALKKFVRMQAKRGNPLAA